MRHRVRTDSGVAIGWVDDPGADGLWRGVDDRWSIETAHETRDAAARCVFVRTLAPDRGRASFASEIVDLMLLSARMMRRLDDTDITTVEVQQILDTCAVTRRRIEELRDEAAVMREAKGSA